MSLSRAGDPHRSQPPDGLLRADGAGVERAGPRRASSPRRRRRPGSAVAPPPHARRERPRPPRRWGRRHCGVRRAPGHPRSSVAGWCPPRPVSRQGRHGRPTRRRPQAGRRGRQGEDGGGHQSKGLGHLVGVVTWEQRRRARAEGSELQRLQRSSREQRQGGDQGVGARQTQDRPQPCPARATTSRSPRVLAIGKRIPRAGEDEHRRTGVSLDGRGLSRRTPQGGEAVPPERRERPDRVDQLHLQGTCLHGRLLLRAIAVPGHGGSRGARVQGFDHDALDSP